MTYVITRPMMTAEELRGHKVNAHGRNFLLSDDGFDDMELNERDGWRSLAAWGEDGWDLGDWPYVVISVRELDGTFQLQQVCEGDHTVYAFTTAEDRDAAIDYLFHWYAADKGYEFSIEWTNRSALDAGEIVVDERFRGPYRSREAS